MRIAAGVILIVAAIFNVIAGAGYALGGGAASMGGDALTAAVQEVNKEAAKQGADEVDVKELAGATEGLDKLASSGQTIMFFGFFLLILFVLQIVCAIFLFMSKGQTFVLAVAGLSILGEIGGIVIISFGFANIFGLLGGVLAIVAAMSIGKAVAAPPAAPAEG